MTNGGAHVDDLVGTVVALSRKRVVTVGRAGDLAFPDNPHLHRYVLAFAWRSDRWWMENVGGWTAVRFGSLEDPMSASLARGRPVAIPAGHTHIVFAAGRTEYEIVVRTPADEQPSLSVPAIPVGQDVTLGPRALKLEQLQMLAAFAEPILQRTCVGITEIASMKDVETRLGWSSAKLRRKLDYLCEKLDEAGVAGLVSESEVPASARRLRLVEWALSTGVVGRDGLRLLELADRADQGATPKRRLSSGWDPEPIRDGASESRR